MRDQDVHSPTGTASLTSWFQLGGKCSTQEDRYWQPIQWKYLENLDDSDEKHLTALWEFCYKDKPDSFDLPDKLLTHAEFHVSNDPWPSIAVSLVLHARLKPYLAISAAIVSHAVVMHHNALISPYISPIFTSI